MEDGEERFQVNEAELRRHALLVMDGIGLAVERLNDPDKLQQLLRAVGVRHYRAGVKPDMLGVRHVRVDFYPFINAVNPYTVLSLPSHTHRQESAHYFRPTYLRPAYLRPAYFRPAYLRPVYYRPQSASEYVTVAPIFHNGNFFQ